MQAEQFIVHPARILISGVSETGKTWTAVDLILRVLSPQIDRWIMVCPTWKTQGIFRQLDHLVKPERDVIEDLQSDTFSIIMKQLLVQVRHCTNNGLDPIRTGLFIDDCGSNNHIHGNRISKFGELSIQLRHLKVSSLVLVQNPKLVSPNYRENANHFIFFPCRRAEDIKWIENEFNSSNYSSQTMRRILKAGWRGGIEDDEEEFGQHFVYILLAARKPIRYFSDFKIELTPKSFRNQIKEPQFF